MEEKYFYEPASGHGLKHDPFNAMIGPRPIGWVSTKGKDGSVNLAPYSFFNAFCYTPPIIGFSSIGRKDTLRNIEESGEFVWNLTDRELAQAMNMSSADAPYGTDEFELAGLEKAPAKLVAPPMVAAAGVNFECKLSEIVTLKNAAGTACGAFLVLGEVVGIHINPVLLREGVFDTFKAGIVLRAGGASAYAEIAPESRFDMKRPG
ncbi:flavin reductase family protein [Acidocella sp.]|uniref:flavin reductase family protein n=1 Tax=Acidocella sp. TaxID=50710 RepID=UPI003D00523B